MKIRTLAIVLSTAGLLALVTACKSGDGAGGAGGSGAAGGAGGGGAPTCLAVGDPCDPAADECCSGSACSTQNQCE